MIKGGPDKQLTDYKEAINWLKQLQKSCNKYFPYTADRLNQVVKILRKYQKSS